MSQVIDQLLKNRDIKEIACDCNGAGRVACSCKTSPYSDGPFFRCHTCHNTGLVICDTCGGAGKVNLESTYGLRFLRRILR